MSDDSYYSPNSLFSDSRYSRAVFWFMKPWFNRLFMECSMVCMPS